MKGILPYILISLLSVQCKHAQLTSPPVSLMDTHWKLYEMNGLPMLAGENSRDVYFVLHSEKGDHIVHGFGGCNSITGSCTLAPDKIRFNIASTMMMCAAGQMEIENFFTKALTSADSYKLKGNRLTLMEGETAVAIFEAMEVKPGG